MSSIDFTSFLKLMAHKKASDLFITAGMPPSMKVNGKNWLLLTNDYVWGHETSKATRAIVEANGGKIIDELMVRTRERLGVTSIVITHDMKSAFHIADRIAYLHEGRIYFYGSPAELEASADPLIQDFLLGRSDTL